MYKKCGHRYKCSCAGNTVPLNTSCGSQPECESPQKCSEVFKGACVIYTGDNLADGDAQGIIIPNGIDVNSAIQKLLSYILNPGCNTPGSPCQSPMNFMSVSSTSMTAKLSWQEVSSSINYVVEYKRQIDSNWTSNPATTSLNDTIGGLIPNTDYFVRVGANCGSNGICYSVVIVLKTKKS